MSENDEIFELPQNENPDSVEPPTKTKKPKKEMSAERKKTILEQLKRGRETALKNRQKKALAKRIEKQKVQEKVDHLIKEEITYANGQNSELTELKRDLKDLKEMLKAQKHRPDLEMKIEKAEIKKEIKKEPKPEPPRPKTPEQPAEKPIVKPTARVPPKIYQPPPPEEEEEEDLSLFKVMRF